MKIPGVSSSVSPFPPLPLPNGSGMSQNDAKAVKKLIAIMNSMTDDEMAHPERIKAPQRERIALKAEAVSLSFSSAISVSRSQTPEEVSTMIQNFQQTLVTYEWLHYKSDPFSPSPSLTSLRKAHGEALPTTEQELASMQSNDARVRNIAAKM
jgi:hypothetical protein